MQRYSRSTGTAPLTLALLALTLGGPCAADSATRHPLERFSEAELLRNYALAACVAHGFEAAEVREDARRAAGAYLEFGSLGFETYEEADALARTWLDKSYVAKEGGSLQLMKCVDMLHSRDLRRLVARHARGRR